MSEGAWILWTAMYFLPSIIGLVREHHSRWAILLLNFFLGWTVLGWIAALIWAATEPRWKAESRMRRTMRMIKEDRS